ncbi:cupin domain-containing protein [Haloplanus ruber]|uniref:Cupin domain-containing protein n=1 Tax=Haloplanus ruber TaxID=869892 RepID=A0ABD6D383_9EURY|nr:cupin domain-containing protein [Haloplanus ruber]
MPRIDFEAGREYDDEQFTATPAFESDRAKVLRVCFEPGQFIPVHAPASDLVVSVREGTGLVREGETSHRVEPGDAIVVPADTPRGIKADDERLEALVMVAPPPTDADHDPVREGLRRGEFDPD